MRPRWLRFALPCLGPLCSSPHLSAVQRRPPLRSNPSAGIASSGVVVDSATVELRGCRTPKYYY